MTVGTVPIEKHEFLAALAIAICNSDIRPLPYRSPQ